MKVHSNFFKTQDREQIFYSTNFPVDFKTKHENVLVFNYGLVCSNHHWKYQLEWFDKQGYKILFHDYRGHFQSSGREELEKITFKQIAQDTDELLTHLGLDNVYYIGHSMGVNITLELARLYPQRIKGMVLISGTTLPVKGVMFDTNLMEYIIPVAEEGLKRYREIFDVVWKTQAMNPMAVKLIHSQGFNEKKVSRDFIEIYMNRLSQLGPELFMQLFGEMQKHDILGDLGTMNMPSLVIGGDKDNVIPYHLQLLLHQTLRNSELYLVKEGSHVPQVDFPEFINERIKQFIDSHQD
ncbi:MAG: alpha/beta hydrolase [Proteobacteria bacterium]|nr:alpha/beta hydrolase [Pseudomonadota bacterium]